ncbi:MAG: APC family permease [Oscillibacter sp.]|jgi:APA family basic amino acid/polyamine antiporter|nr:APC family permease [Oscillibacter sp.]
MGNELEKKYGLPTAICMVVGIVIGSGVFFKAQTILQKTGGNMPLGILAWIIGGVVMLVCVLAFSFMAQKYEKVNGIVDYAEATVGKRYAYNIGWFMTIIYYPTLTSVLAWLSARYTLVFITSVNPDFPLLIGADAGGCVVGPECIALMLFYMCCAYAVNALSPKLAGKLQVSTTVIKLIPLGLMAVVGIIYGISNGTLATNFATVADTGASVSGSPLLAAVCATSFAYEGWIIATSINAELRDAKRNLPKALIAGGIIIMAVYIAYYIGVAGGATNQELIDSGATVAFINVFGNVLGNVLNLFIAISCMGTMNGLMLGCVRGMYSLAARGQGPKPEVFVQVDTQTNLPHNSAIMGLLLCGAWGLYFYLACLAGTWSGPFVFDSSELPIITIYAMYIPIFVMWIKKTTGENAIRRLIVPILAIAGSCFMVYACIVGHQMENVWYLIVYVVVMVIGNLFYRKKA